MELETDEIFKNVFSNSKLSMFITLGDGNNVKTWAIPDTNEIIK